MMIRSQFSVLYNLLMGILLLVSIILSESFYFNGVFSIKPQNISYVTTFLISLILCFILTIILYKHIRRLEKKISEEMKIQALSKQYSTLLNEYMKDFDNKEDIQYLRHDIMNYLQTIHTYSQKEANHEAN